MIFNLFGRKKLITLEDHINYLIKNPKIIFQIDFYRNNQVDYQLIRQSMLKVVGVKNIKNPEGFAISISFNSKKDKNEENFERFKKSTLYNQSIKVENDNGNYILTSDGEINSVITLINQIQKEVYRYNEGTEVQFIFNKFE